MATERTGTQQQIRLGLLGFGEVGFGLALGLRNAGIHSVAAYQRPPLSALTLERIRQSGISLLSSPADLAARADVIVAVTQGAESLDAAHSVAPYLHAAHCYADLASTTPKTKVVIGDVLAASGALYCDGAIEGSPLEHGHRLPIIVSGPGGEYFGEVLNPWGMNIRCVGTAIGKAAAIKGVRQILTKGHIALLIECAMAAELLGISDAVFESAAQWFDGAPFSVNANRLLRTTAVHARRRAEEADMAVAIERELGLEPVMSVATLDLLQRVAALDLRTVLGGVPPDSGRAAIQMMASVIRARPRYQEGNV